MKKMTLKKLFGGICCAAMAMFAVSCAQGVEDETWTAGVSGVQLESPAADSFTVSYVTDASGVENLKVSWPTVMGAGGYVANVWNVTDPNNPETVVENQTIDGSSVMFPLAEDSNYKVSVLTLGNEKLNNAAATTPSETVVSTMIEGIPVPVTEDLGAFISKYIADNADVLAANRAADPNYEIAFDLEAGATYTMATIADCGTQPTRIRGNLGSRPTVVIAEGSNAYFMTAGGLKMKWLNIDAAGYDKQDTGLITMHQNPPADTKLGTNSYMCEKPVRMETCWVKNLKRSIISFGGKQWGVKEFRISDCIIQCNNTGSGAHKTLICGYCGSSGNFPGGDKWYGGIFDTYVVNSTIYNACPADQTKTSAYFIRFSNGDIAKAFGLNGGKFNIQNCTLSRVWPNKDFGNNVGTKNYYTCTFENTIFYDVRLLQKVLSRGCAFSCTNNTIWGVTAAVDGTDKSKGYAAVADPGFTDDNVFKELDFSQPNGGVNFKPTTGNGDPRWLK